MRIAIIGHKRIPGREGGVEVVVEELSIRMTDAGNDVTVYNRYSKNSPNLCQYKGVRIITTPTINHKNLDAVIYSFLASVQALFGKYDVIHYHALGPSVMLVIPHLFRIRTVVTVHGLNYKTPKWKGFGTKYILLGEKIIAKYANEIIVLSQEQRKYFSEKYNRYTTYIPNGISLPTIRKSNQIKRNWDLEKYSYLLFLSRIVPGKGLEYLIQAYKNVNTNIKLVIAGDGGSSYTEDFYAKMKELAKNDPGIVFTGFVKGEILDELYSNAYAFVFPSEAEGMPMCLLEAMSYNCPCLVSNIPENIEIVGSFGTSFESTNVEDLKNKLKAILEKRYNIDKREYISNNYNWDSIVAKTMSLYRGKIEIMPESSVTVLTPTYNRSDKLRNLYRSLKNQKMQDFVWMIVDDGSIDDTKSVVEEFKENTQFEIIYIKKTNGGKHSALNVGINKLYTKLVIIVDSDDELLPDAIESIAEYDKKYGGRNDLCGLSFQKIRADMKSIIKLPKQEFVESYIQCRIKGNLPGDMAEVFYSEILNKYPFPEFGKEKFLSEDIVWIQMGLNYKLAFVAKPIYKCEYLETGLTANDKSMKFQSPMGSMLRGKMLMSKCCGLKSWIRGAIIYNCYSLELHDKVVLSENLDVCEVSKRIFIFATYPIGRYYNYKWKNSIKNEELLVGHF